LADLLERDIEHIAALETLDSGKLIQDSRIDITGAADTFRYFAGWSVSDSLKVYYVVK